jgi:PKD repeat protein
METVNLNSNNPFTRKRKLLITFFVSIFIAIPIGIWLYQNTNQIQLEAKITTNKSLTYAYEDINFFGDHSKGDIKSFLWYFGDGNSSKEKNPIHSFNISGWYNVTLTVIDSKQKTDNSTILIGIQRCNISSPDISPRHGRNIRGSPEQWFDSIFIGPNIRNPDVNIKITLNNPVGTFEIRIFVSYIVNGTQSSLLLHSQNITLMQQMYEFSKKVESKDIPIGADKFLSGIVIIKGECSFTIKMEAFYSLNNCSPPSTGKY